MTEWIEHIHCQSSLSAREEYFSAYVNVLTFCEHSSSLFELISNETLGLKYRERVERQVYDVILCQMKENGVDVSKKCRFLISKMKFEPLPNFQIPLFLLKKAKPATLRDFLKRVENEYKQKLAISLIDSKRADLVSTLMRVDQENVIKSLMSSPMMIGHFLGYLLRERKQNYLARLRAQLRVAPLSLYNSVFCVSLLQEMQNRPDKTPLAEIEETINLFNRLILCLGVTLHSKSPVQILETVKCPTLLSTLISMHRLNSCVIDKNGNTILMAYVQAKRLDLVEVLADLQNQNFNHVNDSQESLITLILNSEMQWSENFRQRATLAASKNLILKDGRNLLHLAVEKRDPTIFKIIASRFPQLLQHRDKTQRTPIDVLKDENLLHYLAIVKRYNQTSFLQLRYYARTTEVHGLRVLKSLRHDHFKELLCHYL